MANIFSNSLATDSIDKFTNKWTVLFVIALALVSFIIPLHPSYHQNRNREAPTSKPMNQPQQAQSNSLTTPKVRVRCWPLGEFKDTMVDYANTYCTNALNSALNGNKDAEVYNVLDTTSGNRHPHSIAKRYSQIKKRYESRIARENEIRSQYDKIEKRESEDRNILESNIRKLVTFQAPFSLLAIALCLALPWMIWAFLTECCSSFNVGQTLESAVQANATDVSSRNLLYKDMVLSIPRGASSPTSCLYLVKKILSIVFIIAILLLVAVLLCSEIKDLEGKVDRLAHPSQADDFGDANSTAPHHVHPLVEMFKHPDDVIICAFNIRRVQDVRTFSLTCSVADLEESIPNEQNDEPELIWEPAKISRDDAKDLLEFDMVVFNIVTAILVILAVSNVVSLCTWLCKLLSHSCRNTIGLPSNAHRDIVFLVQMARLNTSADVAHQLAQAFSGFDKIEDGNEMTEK